MEALDLSVCLLILRTEDCGFMLWNREHKNLSAWITSVSLASTIGLSSRQFSRPELPGLSVETPSTKKHLGISYCCLFGHWEEAECECGAGASPALHLLSPSCFSTTDGAAKSPRNTWEIYNSILLIDQIRHRHCSTTVAGPARES